MHCRKLDLKCDKFYKCNLRIKSSSLSDRVKKEIKLE